MFQSESQLVYLVDLIAFDKLGKWENKWIFAALSPLSLSLEGAVVESTIPMRIVGERLNRSEWEGENGGKEMK